MQTATKPRTCEALPRPTLNRVLGLTEPELDVLCHRLGDTDALALDLAHVGATDQVRKCAALLLQEDMTGARGVCPIVTRIVLAECVEGGTYAREVDEACESGDISREDYLEAQRACYGLARKISEFVGRELQYGRTAK